MPLLRRLAAVRLARARAITCAHCRAIAVEALYLKGTL